MILCLLNGHIYILLFRSGPSSMKGLCMLSEGGLASLYRLGICENLKEKGLTRIVKPPF